MNRSATLLAILLLAGCTRPAKPTPAPSPTPITAEQLARPLPSPLPDPVARVNGQGVPLRNVALEAKEAGASSSLPPPKLAAAYRQAMYKLIVREILFQEASARKLVADDKQMQQAYDEARISYKDDAAWADFLKEQGLDVDSFRAELRIQFTVRRLIDQEEGKVSTDVTTEATQEFYDKNPSFFETGERIRASGILLRIPEGIGEGRKAELKTKAEGLLARIRKGEDFAKVAKQFSEDPGSAPLGGALKIFSKGEMPKQVEEVAYALAPNQVSDVFESPAGFHILKLHEKLPSVKRPFGQVEGRIKQYIVEQRRLQALETLIAGLKSKASIETYL
jgi:peptidyl-prolyl cis-trans isomerase C